MRLSAVVYVGMAAPPIFISGYHLENYYDVSKQYFLQITHYALRMLLLLVYQKCIDFSGKQSINLTANV